MARFKAVFLDIGGTLLRMGKASPVYRDILADFGYELALEQVERAVAKGREASNLLPAGKLPDLTVLRDREEAKRDEMVRVMLAELGVERDFESCRQAIWTSWLGTRVFERFDESIEVLAWLRKQGYVIGAVSNWEARLELLCANHGLREYFDFVVASEAEGYIKPSPFLYQKALQLANVSPDHAIHIGDSFIEDVQAAEAVGITSVHLLRQGERQIDHSPTIRTLRDLLPLLEASEWIHGRVESGVGQAAGFTEIPWVRQQAEARLGFLPYPGTLNLRLELERDLESWKRVRFRPGLPIEPEPGFCAARCFPVAVDGIEPAVIVLPEVQNYPPDVIELLAPVRLRDSLQLVDGARVTLAVPAE